MNLLNMSNVVKFKLPDITYNERPPVTQETATPKTIEPEKKKPVVIEAMPWEPMQEGLDYRPILQRDGLILWYWERYSSDGLIRIVWMKSCGNMRRYQCWADEEDDLLTVFPEKKCSKLLYYKGKYIGMVDGDPDYIVYAAPRDLTFSVRDAFIAKLRDFGVMANFDYEFTLGKQKTEKGATVLDRIENRLWKSNLNSEEAELL